MRQFGPRWAEVSGEVITWASVVTSGSLDACADLYASGKKIVTGTCDGVSGPFTIPTTGSYIFVVHVASA